MVSYEPKMAEPDTRRYAYDPHLLTQFELTYRSLRN
jgi:hypothetical protein